MKETNFTTDEHRRTRIGIYRRGTEDAERKYAKEGVIAGKISTTDGHKCTRIGMGFRKDCSFRSISVNPGVSVVILFFFAASVFSESSDIITKYPNIKELVDRRNPREAQRQIDKVLKENEGDPTIALYQTEVWIQQGENNYQAGNLKTAFSYFKKAYDFWPSHPLVNQRYKDLSKRRLSDRTGSSPVDESNLKQMATNSGRVFYIIDSSSPGNEELRSALRELKEEVKSLQKDRGVTESGNSPIFKVFSFLFGAVSIGLGAMIYRMKKGKI
ncbi:MAG: tetratricopeptide repeat protein [Leptospira sp.]|nr:tetratricopeptide repeat protein [Leptospira sp.]